jgi:hypothetical protein
MFDRTVLLHIANEFLVLSTWLVGPSHGDVIFVHILVCNIFSAHMSSSLTDGLDDLVVPALILCALHCTALHCTAPYCKFMKNILALVGDVVKCCHTRPDYPLLGRTIDCFTSQTVYTALHRSAQCVVRSVQNCAVLGLYCTAAPLTAMKSRVSGFTHHLTVSRLLLVIDLYTLEWPRPKGIFTSPARRDFLPATPEGIFTSQVNDFLAHFEVVGSKTSFTGLDWVEIH